MSAGHDGARDAASAQSLFDGIVLDYSAQRGAVDAADQLRRSYAGRRPGRACGGAILIAPMGTGKTMMLDMLARRVAEENGETWEDGDVVSGTRRVLLVQTPTEGNVDSIPTAILRALKKPRPDLGRPELRWHKALNGMREAGVELTAFDEFNRSARRPTMSRPIATSIRERLMDAGVSPVLFVGSEEASVTLKGCPELAERLDDRIPLDPLNWTDDGDKQIAEALLKELDSVMIARDIVARSNMAAFAEELVAASGGRIRSLMKIVRAALGIAIDRNARRIAREDLAEATDRLPRSSGFIASNPFEGGGS